MSEQYLPPIYWEGEEVAMIDQRVLPKHEKILKFTTPQQIIKAIKNMTIRGAPAVGVAGAMALAVGARRIEASDAKIFKRKFEQLCQQVKKARPTGNNLSWAVERIYSVVVENPRSKVSELQQLIRQKADEILAEDIAGNKSIGAWGKSIIPAGARILTYCNAGALATADYGTALGVIRAAHAADPSIQVLACETRPFLQGSRLTAYELMRSNIPVTVLTDNAVGSIMQQQRVDVVVVGADRIAANGDTANKIGTYTVAVLANTHNIPFYVAAPRSTIDPSIADGSGIPIEERSPSEVTHIGGRNVAPKGIPALNPAFDVTPSKYLTGIITEVGILRRPYRRAIRKALET
ncbi:MAG: S-methyl-5-thioribose-1-phosphate isomerase [Desulfoferrobacter sp.]